MFLKKSPNCAMRRIWAHIMQEKFKAKNERSMWFRTARQTSALPLTAQEPLNNIVRAEIQTLAAVLAGVQSIHTTGYDEAFFASHRRKPQIVHQNPANRAQGVSIFFCGQTKTAGFSDYRHYLFAFRDR